jgi:hypothetical protein
MANMDRLRLLLEVQARGYTLAAALLIRQLTALWRGFDQWYDGDLVASRAARSATLVDSAQGSVRTQTISYMKFVYQQFDDLQFPSADEIDAANDDVLERLVSPLDEWNRPAEQFRFARSQGSTVEEATEIAIQRVEALADLDMELAMRKQANTIFKATPKVTGYRRVLHPELAESGTSCGLCIAASTRVYKKKELLPIHDHCHCGVMPIVGDEDPGDVFNQDDLNQLYAAAGGNTAQALSRARFKIEQHGELGPYLVEHGSKTRGKISPSQTKISRRESVAAQLKSLNESLPRLLARQRAGEDVSEAIVWQQDRLRLLNAEDAEFRRPSRRRNR